jgi:hypothetical protein
MIKKIALIFIMSSSFSVSYSKEVNNRITVVQDDNSYIKTLEEICEAASSEDINKYFSLFASSTKTQKKKIALFFMSNKISMTLLDNKVIELKDKSAELAIEYKMVLNDDSYIIVALVEMRKIGSDWKLLKESVVSKKLESRCRSGNCRAVQDDAFQDVPVPNCANGRCNVQLKFN